MLWYDYRQNNSGGRFIGPALYVFVEATNSDIADAIAQRLGVYFNGCSTGADCSCCGDRWYSPWEGEEEKPEPYEHSVDWADRENLILAIYVYDNGKRVDFIGVPADFKAEKLEKMKVSLLTD